MGVDHCHATGKVRGLLCHPCNAGLGFYRDDPRLMREAAAYIERSRADACPGEDERAGVGGSRTPDQQRDEEAVGVGAARGHQQALVGHQHGAPEQIGALAQRVRDLGRRHDGKTRMAREECAHLRRRSPRPAPSR